MPKMTVPPDQRSKALQYYYANREARKAKALQWNKDNPEALQASKERAHRGTAPRQVSPESL